MQTSEVTFDITFEASQTTTDHNIFCLVAVVVIAISIIVIYYQHKKIFYNIISSDMMSLGVIIFSS